MILGCDISTTELTLCFLAENAIAWERAALRRDRSQGKWTDALGNVQAALSTALSDAPRPAEAYIERGWGANRNADYQLGAIFGATYVALGKAVPGIHVEMMTTHQWKKIVTAKIGMTTKKGVPGLATATKDQANSACRILLMDELFLDAERVQRLSPDELDAFGVAYAATHGS